MATATPFNLSLHQTQRLKAPAPGSARAAQYVRMSTDMQQYSPANQREAIARYAAEHGLEIVRTYSDEGRSGLSIQGRDGLNQLLADVATGRADYSTVLVYDVSRWGRFQDCDESAFYEYLCRRAGIQVEYCMEPFANDGTPISAVLKSLKRVMAGEFSRELSEKVFHGKCRGTRLGFRQGATAGFGLRRMVLDPSGRPRGILERGEHKFLSTDRVILVPGPPEEVAEVRHIFRQFARGKRPLEIARDLNARGVRTPEGGRWRGTRVLDLVMNERYIGNLIFNRTRSKMRSRAVPNPADEWVRADGAFKPLVNPSLFRRVQRTIARWGTRITDAEAVSMLRRLLAKQGRLSAGIIDAEPGMPSSSLYDQRFGGLERAYALVGYKPQRRYRHLRRFAEYKRQCRAFRDEVIAKLSDRAPVRRLSSCSVSVNGVSVAIRLASRAVGSRGERWTVRKRRGPSPDWVLVARRTPDGTAIQDYCVAEGSAAALALGGPHRRARVWYAGTRLEVVLDTLLDPARLAGMVGMTESDTRRRAASGCAQKRHTP